MRYRGANNWLVPITGRLTLQDFDQDFVTTFCMICDHLFIQFWLNLVDEDNWWWRGWLERKDTIEKITGILKWDPKHQECGQIKHNGFPIYPIVGNCRLWNGQVRHSLKDPGRRWNPHPGAPPTTGLLVNAKNPVQGLLFCCPIYNGLASRPHLVAFTTCGVRGPIILHRTSMGTLLHRPPSRSRVYLYPFTNTDERTYYLTLPMLSELWSNTNNIGTRCLGYWSVWRPITKN